MINLTRAGQLFYSLGIIAYGIQQLIIRDFRPQILPAFPSWAHTIVVFPLLTGVLMIVAGLIVSGIVKIPVDVSKKTAFVLACYFLTLILFSHIPYLLFVYPHKLSHLGSWGDLLKALAFCGASLIIAGDGTNRVLFFFGRLFYCTTIILFGCNHFVYDLSFMVPEWFGMSTFWSYFGGAALIASGCAVLVQQWHKPAALLLALMLFLWFIFLHAPGAIAHPHQDRGNLIVSAFDALLFCGTALIISQADKKMKNDV